MWTSYDELREIGPLADATEVTAEWADIHDSHQSAPVIKKHGGL